MNAAITLDHRPPAPSHADLVSRVETIAREHLRPLAHRIDEGHYPLEIMEMLGQTGALGVHLARSGERYDLAIAAMAAASRACGSTGFLIWAHLVCGMYLEACGNPEFSQTLLETHAAGRSFGGTALSNPVKALTGIEPFLLHATRTAGGYIVRGTLPWVSHIAPGQYFGAMALVDAGDRGNKGNAGQHPVLFMIRCDERISLRPCPPFSGMEGTSTWGVRLDGIFVPDSDVVADPAGPFVQRIRAPFILLQTGMALGVIQGAIDDIREVEGQLGHVNRFLEDQADELAAEHDQLHSAAMALARTPWEDGRDYLVDVLDARIRGSELALRATQAALLHQGARLPAPPRRSAASAKPTSSRS
jgi:alkylation response protein AidB-like acyl-CoA dehydrogenase